MNPVLIIVAMRFEAAQIEKRLALQAQHDKAVFPYVEGEINGCPVAICAGGVGKINAAAATAVMIERMKPQLVINTGCAGAYWGTGLSIGDLAIANEEILGDEGATTSLGWLDLRDMNLPCLTDNNQRYFNEIPLSSNASERALQLAKTSGIQLTTGRFITVSNCSGSLKQGELLAKRYNGLVENMEGAAVALTCLRYGIECLEVRGISNMVDERNLEKWNIKLAVDNAQDFVLQYLEEISSKIDS